MLINTRLARVRNRIIIRSHGQGVLHHIGRSYCVAEETKKIYLSPSDFLEKRDKDGAQLERSEQIRCLRFCSHRSDQKQQRQQDVIEKPKA